MLCPELVGRAAEAAALRERVARLSGGTGGVVVLVGDAGVGKTRLAQVAAEAARAAAHPVLAGRAVPSTSPVAYRPLTEALANAFRADPLPTSPSLAGFGAHLGRLVPQWRVGSPASDDDSPVLLAEAVVRLLAAHRHAGERDAPTGALLLLEDLHWADPETIDVVDFFTDALRSEPVLCVCTARDDGAASSLLERISRRDPAAVVVLERLPDDAVDTMVAACLATDAPPAELVPFLRAHSDGNPFLVEELLAGLVASGDLHRDDGRWTTTGQLHPTVPTSLRDSIGRRLSVLDPMARRVLGAAAVLGRRFDWELLPGIADLDGRAVVDALRAGVDEQLVEVEGDGFAFRHALTREAIAGTLLPPERRELAARAWPAVERAHPGLPGPVCELAAELAEAAGEPAAAAARLVESARRAYANGALATAEATARRARRLADGDLAVVLDADTVLVDVLVAAGKPAAAATLGRDLVDRLAASAAPAARQIDARLTIARAELGAGDPRAAASEVEHARAAGGATVEEALAARVDTVAANVALELADLERAIELSRAGAARARATEQPAVECEALLVLGRAVRAGRVRDAEQPFEAAADVASAAGLATWHLRAQQELAITRWPRGVVDDLHRTRALAVRYGALHTVAVMDLTLADIALAAFDRDACRHHATACVEASERFGLATAPVAHLWLAGAHALGGDDAEMQREVDASLVHDRDDARILGDLYGRVLPTRALVAGDLDDLRGLLDTMMEHVPLAAPGTSVFPGRVMWALLHAIDDDDLGVPARAELDAAAARMGLPIFEKYLEVCDAIVLGRRGERDDATAAMARANDDLLAVGLSRGMLHANMVLVARAALRDGWGDPVRWLREAEAFFGAGGYGDLARRCRLLLGEAGASVPRRGRGDSVVPPALRALGVTSREVDVLKLVVAGRSNKDIAAELFLSPKTVERHVSSLFDRIGVRDRRGLAAAAAHHLGDASPN